VHTSTVNILSRFGWGLARQIEDHGISRFRENLQKSRQGLSAILSLLRQQPMALGLSGSLAGSSDAYKARERLEDVAKPADAARPGRWASLKAWLRAGD
jgi:hypothetical protein